MCPLRLSANKIRQKEIANFRQEYVDKVLEDGNSNKSFYAAAKALFAPGGTQRWCVADLFPRASPGQVCDNVLGYFSGIGGALVPPPPEVPRKEASLPKFMPTRTTTILKKAKKTDSKGNGDPMAHLVTALLYHLPASSTRLISPRPGQEIEVPYHDSQEHKSVDLSECRNISCTSMFSEVMENQLLEQLKEELWVDKEQNGGLKGCGVEHMLTELWEEVLTAMEVDQCAGVLLGIDFK